MSRLLLSRREFLLTAAGWFRRRRFVTLAGIRFEVLREGRARNRFLLIHGNEQTAREVLLGRAKTKRPMLAYLVTGPERYIRMGAIRFDPNRIFSREGAEKNLSRLNPRLAAADLRAALARLDREREKLVRALLPERGGLILALHNNSEGYSVEEEVPISDEVRLSDPGHPRDFCLSTDAADFRKLRGSPYNVVLQNRAPKEDDGSLSRLAARRGVRYVNIETALGSLEKQRRMFEWVESNLG